VEDVGSATATLLAQLSRLVKSLKADDVQALLAGETKIMLVPKGSKVVTPLVLADVAAEVRRLATADEIISLLDADKRLNANVLRQLAGELNLTVPGSAKAKSAIVLYIAQTAADYRRRSHGGI